MGGDARDARNSDPEVLEPGQDPGNAQLPIDLFLKWKGFFSTDHGGRKKKVEKCPDPVISIG